MFQQSKPKLLSFYMYQFCVILAKRVLKASFIFELLYTQDGSNGTISGFLNVNLFSVLLSLTDLLLVLLLT